MNLNHIASRMDFRCDDGLNVMVEFANRKDAIYFIDPPYTAGGKSAGRRLYKYHQIKLITNISFEDAAHFRETFL